MRQPTLSGVVKRRFLHCVNKPGRDVARVVEEIGISPGDLCQLISGQQAAALSLATYHRVARWLHMPLANVLALAGLHPKLPDLVRLGMEARGYRATCAQHQEQAAREAGVSVAVFRRALHGYADFTPSILTCDRLAAWLAWTGLEPDDIVTAAGMIVRYHTGGKRTAVAPALAEAIQPYPCACGRAGCMVPAHLPVGPRRLWRSDACRMWARRQAQRDARLKGRGALAAGMSALPHPRPLKRFITINERPVPVRF